MPFAPTRVASRPVVATCLAGGAWVSRALDAGSAPDARARPRFPSTKASLGAQMMSILNFCAPTAGMGRPRYDGPRFRPFRAGEHPLPCERARRPPAMAHHALGRGRSLLGLRNREPTPAPDRPGNTSGRHPALDRCSHSRRCVPELDGLDGPRTLSARLQRPELPFAERRQPAENQSPTTAAPLAIPSRRGTRRREPAIGLS